MQKAPIDVVITPTSALAIPYLAPALKSYSKVLSHRFHNCLRFAIFSARHFCYRTFGKTCFPVEGSTLSTPTDVADFFADPEDLDLSALYRSIARAAAVASVLFLYRAS